MPIEMSDEVADVLGEPIRLSVVIACFDAEATLGEQLEALASQPCPVSWELLVCDNGSTDGSVQVAEQYRGRLPLRIVDASAERGPGAARNTGAAHAVGEWLAFCDADDVVADDWLAQMSAALERYEFVAGRFDGRRLNDARILRSRSLDQTEDLQYSDDGQRRPHAGAGNMGIHRGLFRSVGGFDTTLTCLEDTDLSWRVQQTGVALHFVPEVLVHVRLRSTLRQMFRQGSAYGVAHALLEDRYGVGSEECDQNQGAGLLASTGRRGVRAVVSAWVGRQPSLGRFLWQLGWHLGHHRARRQSQRTPTLSNRSSGPPPCPAAERNDESASPL